MKNRLAYVLSGLGVLMAGVASTGSFLALFDEPKMPKQLIEK